jgi:hypothetical protein
MYMRSGMLSDLGGGIEKISRCCAASSAQWEEDKESSSKTKKHTSIEKGLDAYLHEMGVPDATIKRMYSVSADELVYLTKEELNTLTSTSGIQWLKDLSSARCGHYVASSPEALECENTVIREVYWNGARELLSQNK